MDCCRYWFLSSSCTAELYCCTAVLLLRCRRERAINDAQQMMAMQQSMAGGAMNPMGFDVQKAFDAEAKHMNLVSEQTAREGAGGGVCFVCVYFCVR